MTPGGSAVLLGVSCDYHDAACALLVDGAVVAAVEEERLSRIKHDADTPARAIESCLAVAGVDPDEVDSVTFYERPVDALSRFVSAKRRQGPTGLRSFLSDAPRLLGANLMISYRLDRVLRSLGARSSPEFLYCDHHRSHAASAFFPSPFESAAILTVDGMGEWATASISRGSGSRIDMIEELRYPDSLGLFYSFATAYCGFEPNTDEYKLMGLAPYGEPRFVAELSELLEQYGDGSLGVDARRLGWFSSRGMGRSDLHDLLDGPPTQSGGEPTQRDADLAASTQLLTERAITRLAQRALEVTGESALCMAGGVALNCVANGVLVADECVSDLWVQPAAGDSGAALGAALSTWHEMLERPRRSDGTDSMSGALLGPAVELDELHRWLKEEGIDHTQIDDRAELCSLVAARLADGAVVGWFQGRMEFGPRALGNRSILADPRSSSTRSHINRLVKGRESFRPFAPAVLAERAQDLFDLRSDSPYMLLTAPVSSFSGRVDRSAQVSFAERGDAVGSDIPACTHVDGSARVQTVDRAVNPVFHQLIAEFDRMTGCPVLLNTSFNLAGEPIVASPVDALATAAAAHLDLLVVEDVVLEPASWGTT